jgi:enoyl-CoA hydratase/carnithine racemase
MLRYRHQRKFGAKAKVRWCLVRDTVELEPLVQVERHALGEGMGEARILRLNRPGQLNPIDWSTVRILREELEVAAADSLTRVILLTGNGRAFSAGGDLTAYLEMQTDHVGFPQFLHDLHSLILRMGDVPQPVIGLVNGITAAGGLELMLGCDLTIALNSAKIGDAHLNFGQMGGGGVLTLLPTLIGPARARELIFSGDFISATRAAEIGLVNQVVDHDLEEAGLELAAKIAKHSSLALSNAKTVLNSVLAHGTGIMAGMQFERERAAYYCLTSNDSREGLEAFADKRDPQFSGS